MSGLTVTQSLTMSDSDDDDRRSRREEREEGPPKEREEGPPKPEQKKRRRKSTSQGKPLEESTAADTSKNPEAEAEAPAEELAEATVPVPTVKQPPVSPDTKPVKGKKGKGKGKGKKGKAKGKEVGSPRSCPGKPNEPFSPMPTSREIWSSQGPQPGKQKLQLTKSGFSKSRRIPRGLSVIFAGKQAI